jgi:hypothetical protein
LIELKIFVLEDLSLSLNLAHLGGVINLKKF